MQYVETKNSVFILHPCFFSHMISNTPPPPHQKKKEKINQQSGVLVQQPAGPI